MTIRQRVLVAAVGAALYCGAVTWYLLAHGGWPTPDFLIPPLLLPALLLNRGRAFLLDWAPFLVLLLAWEATRGIADLLGMPVHVAGPARLEEALFFGHVPTVELQRWLYDADRGSRWFDWLGAVLHSLHFALPVAFGFAVWLCSRVLFRRYVVSVLVLFLLGFAGFVLFPQAPPWLAGTQDVIPYTYRIGVGTILSLPVEDQVVLAYNHIRPNNVAAMPSLHAALPALLTLILWRLKRSLGFLGGGYTLLLAFFLVYHGEHYVIDILAGWALAGAVYWLVWSTPAWLYRLLPAEGAPRRRALTIPATAVGSLLLVVGLAASLRPNAFGAEPAILLPPPPEPEPVVEERLDLTGPCGVSQSLAGLADRLLAPVAGQYAAYLTDPELGLCMALTDSQAPPPPDREEQRALLTPSAAPDSITIAASDAPGDPGIRLSAAGSPSVWLAAAGMPPGRYVLVVELRDVPDPDAAGRAVAEIARLTFGPPY